MPVVQRQPACLGLAEQLDQYGNFDDRGRGKTLVSSVLMHLASSQIFYMPAYATVKGRGCLAQGRIGKNAHV